MFATVVKDDHLPDKGGVSVIDFSATWCGPCKAYTPVFDRVSGEFADNESIHFFKVDIDENPKLAAQYGVSAVPTTIVLKDGAQVASRSGAMPATSLTLLVDTHK